MFENAFIEATQPPSHEMDWVGFYWARLSAKLIMIKIRWLRDSKEMWELLSGGNLGNYEQTRDNAASLFAQLFVIKPVYLHNVSSFSIKGDESSLTIY